MTSSSITPYLIFPDDTSYTFPDISQALQEPNGLLAIGGDLVPERLLAAYTHGIFPWYNKGEPVLWWSPDPRAVMFPDKFIVSRSLKKFINKNPFRVTCDTAFRDVINACQKPRITQKDTWITPEMLEAYCIMHELGYAHSVECWEQDELVGGLYGMALGKVFFGESMFSLKANASKVAMYYLTRWLIEWKFELIDCQVTSDHLLSLGAEDIPRSRFRELLGRFCPPNQHTKRWGAQ